MIARILSDLAPSAAAVTALELSDPVERRLLGQTPPYAPRTLASALLRRFARRATPTRARRLGTAMRWAYGLALGVGYVEARRRVAARPSRAALTLAGAIYGFELLTLPLLVGKRLYRPRTMGALALHVALFSAVLEAVA